MTAPDVVPAAATAALEVPAPSPAKPEPETPPEPAAAADQGDKGEKKDPAPATDAEEMDDPLGPQGRKALEAWKTRAKEAETTAKTQATALAEALAKLADKDLPAEEQALAAARREGESTATATVTAAAARALAAQALVTEAKGRLADPSDVVAFLDPGDIKVGDGFSLDSAAIAGLVDDLLARKPHLGVKPGQPGPVVPAGPIGQGVRTKDTPSLQQRAAQAVSDKDYKGSVNYKAQQLFQLQAAQTASGA